MSDDANPQAPSLRYLAQVVSLSCFRPLVPRYQVMEPDARPYLILITTYEQDAGLEISELAIVELEDSR